MQIYIIHYINNKTTQIITTLVRGERTTSLSDTSLQRAIVDFVDFYGGRMGSILGVGARIRENIYYNDIDIFMRRQHQSQIQQQLNPNLNIMDKIDVVLRHQCYCTTSLTRPSCATYSMNIIDGYSGHIKVDDQVNLGYILGVVVVVVRSKSDRGENMLLCPNQSIHIQHLIPNSDVMSCRFSRSDQFSSAPQ